MVIQVPMLMYFFSPSVSTVPTFSLTETIEYSAIPALSSLVTFTETSLIFILLFFSFSISFLFTYVAPLSIVLGITICKEGYDDYQRYLRDKEFWFSVITVYINSLKTNLTSLHFL